MSAFGGKAEVTRTSANRRFGPRTDMQRAFHWVSARANVGRGWPWGQTMTDTERGIALATLDDVSGILDLQDRNLSDRGGSLSVPFSRNWFETAVANAQVIVARSNGRVVGYLVFCTFAAQAH